MFSDYKMRWGAGVSTIAIASLLASCGGSAGGGTAGGGDRGDGFEFGASQDEVSALIADLEPVTLTYQAASASQDAVSAGDSLVFKEAVEERSEGKITVDIAWGSPITGPTEVEDALADGRIDVGWTHPIYLPQEHPTVDALSKLTPYGAQSPMVGEIATSAALSEIAWGSDELLSVYTDQGLTPISPLMSIGDFMVACTDPAESIEDWGGRQMRISGTAHTAVTEAIGGSPVSMEFGEIYEALQRNTVDCTFTQAATAAGRGVFEVAPTVYHMPDSRMSGSTNSALVAGTSMKDLPLAYQQIIFDAQVDHLHGTMQMLMDSNAKMAADVKAARGEITEFDAETAEAIDAAHDTLVDELIEAGRVEENAAEGFSATAQKWVGIAEELGFEDKGTLNDFDEWYEPGSIDFRPLAERVFEESEALSHRPA